MIENLKNKPLLQATLGDLALMLKMSMREEVLEGTDDTAGADNAPTRKLFGIKAIAEELGISVPTVKRHLKDGLYGKAVWKVNKLWVADSVKLWAIFKCNQTLRYSRQYPAA